MRRRSRGREVDEKSDGRSSNLACVAFILSVLCVLSPRHADHVDAALAAVAAVLGHSPPSRGEGPKRKRTRKKEEFENRIKQWKKLLKKLSRPLSFLSLFSPSRSLPLARAIPLAPRLETSSPPFPLLSSEEEERISAQSLFLPQSNPRCRCALVTRCSATTKAAVRRAALSPRPPSRRPRRRPSWSCRASCVFRWSWREEEFREGEKEGGRREGGRGGLSDTF